MFSKPLHLFEGRGWQLHDIDITKKKKKRLTNECII